MSAFSQNSLRRSMWLSQRGWNQAHSLRYRLLWFSVRSQHQGRHEGSGRTQKISHAWACGQTGTENNTWFITEKLKTPRKSGNSNFNKEKWSSHCPCEHGEGCSKLLGDSREKARDGKRETFPITSQECFVLPFLLPYML